MSADAILFWILAAVTLASALTVVMIANPIYSALSLAMTMVGVSALFVTLDAFFIAGVQLIVYAGAVMVLFVMVLMLFDLKQEIQAFSRGKFTGALKILSVGLMAGLIVGAIFLSPKLTSSVEAQQVVIKADNSKQLGQMLFSKYILGFEVLGVLLLVVAVGTVALSRSRGGTHAKH